MLNEFKGLKTSAENIAYVIWHILRSKIEPNLKIMVRLWETENNVVEYNGE